ncbi:MAG: hypothetical protein VKN72_18025 [Nostocales cyanobacterium 94392]|nr:hypothetical protein [Nostocales cyanobacterium 94392]
MLLEYHNHRLTGILSVRHFHDGSNPKNRPKKILKKCWTKYVINAQIDEEIFLA